MDTKCSAKEKYSVVVSDLLPFTLKSCPKVKALCLVLNDFALKRRPTPTLTGVRFYIGLLFLVDLLMGD